LPVDLRLIDDFEPGVSDPSENLELTQERIPGSFFAPDGRELGPIQFGDETL
jgi:hypothetical protein